MGLGTAFANAGLMEQGMDARQLQDQNISDLQQQARARGQQIEAGDIGLEDVKRTHATAASLRNAVSSSNPDDGTAGIYHNVAQAALASGDLGTYENARAASKALQDEGWGKIAMAALTGAPPDQTEQQFNALGVAKMVPGSLEYGKDPKTGDIIASAINVSDGKRYPFNATQYAKLHGLIKTEAIKLGPNEKAVTQGGAEIASNPVDQYKASGNIIYNSKTGAWQDVDTKGEWKLGTIVEGNNEVPVEINTKNGSINRLGKGGVRTGLEAKISQPTTPGAPVMVTMPGGAVAEFKPATEATPGKTNWLSANEPGKPAQPATLETITQTEPEQPPVQGARKAADGKWYVRQGDGYAEVIPKAATTPSGTPGPAAPAPKAAAAKPMQPTPKAAPDVLDEGQAYEAQDQQLATLGARARMFRQGKGSGSASVAAQAVAEYSKRLEELKGGQSAPAAGQTPFQKAGIEVGGGTPTKTFGTAPDQVGDLLKRGTAFEEDDPALRSAGRLLHTLTSTKGTARNPSILRGAIEDYERRLAQLEKTR